MHKNFWLLLIAFLFGAQFSFAQVRDLFAEFESEAAEAAPASSAAEAPAVSSAAVSSATVASSAAAEPAPVSSAAAVSSAAEVPASSSAVAPAPAEVSFSSVVAVAPVDSAAVKADSSAAPVPADSAKAKSDSAAVDTAAVQNDTSAVSSSAMESSSSAESSSVAESSSSAVESSSSSAPVVVLSSSAMSRRDLLGPVKVSKVHSIDEMKGKYRSPKKALFMSLVVPGSGQLYVGGTNFTYVRGGAYLALEAALWGGWYYFSVYKYDKQVNRYKKFAKEHYSIGRYEKEMYDIVKNQLADETEESNFEHRYMSTRESFCEALYGKGNAAKGGCYVSGKLFDGDREHANKFRNNPVTMKDENVGSFYDPAAIYQHIADRTYVLGWDDMENQELAMNLDLSEDSPSEIKDLATSDHMEDYRSMRSKANDYANLQARFFGGLILNHIVSAVDAAFTANSHNKELYSEELSWYDHLHFDSYLNLFNGVDVGVQASWGF